MSDSSSPAGPVKSIPIKWDYDSKNIQTRYATNITIQHTENEFFIAFYEMRPPILLGNDEQVKKEMENIDYIDAECVARVAVNANKMPKFITAMQENYSNFEKSFRSTEESGE